MKRILQKVSQLTVACLLVVGLSSGLAAAQSTEDAKSAVCTGIGAIDGTDGCEDPEESSSLGDTVANIINLVSLIVGVVAVIMVIVGGLRYVTSQGDSGSTKSAKDTIVYAIIGLIVVALAQLIVRFTVDRTTQEAPATTQTQTQTNSQPPIHLEPGETCPRDRSCFE